MKRVVLYFLFTVLNTIAFQTWANPEDEFLDFLDRSAEQARIQVLKNDELISHNKISEGVYFFDFRKQYNDVEMVSVVKANQLNQVLAGYNNNVIVVLMPLNALGDGGKSEAISTMQKYSERVVSKVDANGEKTVVCINTTIEEVGSMFSNPVVMVGHSADQLIADNIKSSFANIGCKQFECFLEAILQTTDFTILTANNNAFALDVTSISQRTQSTGTLPVYCSYKVRFTKVYTTSSGGHEGMNELYHAMVEAPEISIFIPDGRKEEFANSWAMSWQWVNAGRLENKEYTFTVTYDELWKLFYTHPDIKLTIEEMILELYPEDYIKEFLTSYINSFSYENITYFLKIAHLAKLIGRDLWYAYRMDKTNQNISAVYWQNIQRFYDGLMHFYEQQHDVIARIMQCTSPGQSEGEMTYWCNVMAQGSVSQKYFYALTPAQRYHILKIMSSGSMDGTDEYYAIQVITFIKTTEERRDLYNFIKIDRTTLYNLYDGIDGDNLELFNDQLIACFAITFNEADYGKGSIRAFRWPESASEGVSHRFTDSNTKIEFIAYYGAGLGDASPHRKDPVTVYIEEPVCVNYGETSIFIPAICFYRKINVREFYNNLSGASSVLDLIAVGTAAKIIVRGTPGLIRVIAYAELINFSLDLMFEVPEIKSKILEIRGGSEFLAAWPYINTAVDLTTVGADLLKNFVDGYGKIQRKGGVLDQLPVEGQDVVRSYYKSCEVILFLHEYPALLRRLNSLRTIYGVNYLKLEEAIFHSSEKVLKALDDDITLLDELGDIQDLEVNDIVTKLDGITNVGLSVYKVGDNIFGKIIVNIRPGINGKIAIVGRKMDNHVNEVVDKLQKQGLQVEAFNEIYQRDNIFVIDGQNYTWKQIVDDFTNPINPITGQRKYASINSKGWIADSDIPNTLMYKANQQWVQKLINEGYEVIDIGFPAGQSLDPSLFYNMELNTLFP